ncbi:hypothetical protein C450_04543 [Halococcus salifodinae DSM 8989]|uniref:Uncharacterized protein n=1 Tax=Halococcus salifodinae DSM 8989 TaxID=1227456 RepID=M0NAE9_9EURY|nr:hypothetical protein C450_04543 [Halococcus salifodinae DSM 8989]
MMSSQNGTSPSQPQSLEEIVHEYAPPGESWPSLPAFHPESGWEFSTVHRRTRPGREDETQICPATGEEIPVSEPHICVTVRRDEWPGESSSTAEFKQFVFPNRDTLRQWFEEDDQ